MSGIQWWDDLIRVTTADFEASVAKYRKWRAVCEAVEEQIRPLTTLVESAPSGVRIKRIRLAPDDYQSLYQILTEKATVAHLANLRLSPYPFPPDTPTTLTIYGIPIVEAA